jgi:hypothetical protein
MAITLTELFFNRSDVRNSYGVAAQTVGFPDGLDKERREHEEKANL